MRQDREEAMIGEECGPGGRRGIGLWCGAAGCGDWETVVEFSVEEGRRGGVQMGEFRGEGLGFRFRFRLGFG